MSEISRPSSVEKVMKWIAFGMSVKATMLEHGVRSHMQDCPFCERGKITAALAGHKEHLVLACNTPDCIRMRE